MDGCRTMEYIDDKDRSTVLTNSKSVIIGRLDWLLESGIEISKSIQNTVDKMRDNGYGISILAIEGKAVAVFSFSHDEAREGVKELIQDLKERDIKKIK